MHYILSSPITSSVRGSGFVKIAAIGAITLYALSACSSLPSSKVFSGPQSPQSASINIAQITADPDYTNLNPVERVTLWAKYHERAQNDPAVIEAFSTSLRAIGSLEQALSITAPASVKFPAHRGIQLEYAKALLADDRAFEAVRPLERAIEITQSEDWRILSIYGVALDRIKEHERAQLYYQKALELSPHNPKILNNLGLSLALAGHREKAEVTLRTAAATQNATAQIRQNLSLILAIGGQTDEAAQLARSDLPPELAEKNIRYFQQLHEKPDYWGNLPDDTANMPKFGTSPSDIKTERAQPQAKPLTPAAQISAPRDHIVPPSLSKTPAATTKLSAGLKPSEKPSANQPPAPVSESATMSESSRTVGTYDRGTLNRRPRSTRGR